MRIAIFHNLPSGGAKRTLYETVRRLSPQHELDVYTLSSANHGFGDLRPDVDRHFVYPFIPLPLLKSPFGRLNQIIRTLDLLRVQSVYRKIAVDIDNGNYDIAYVQPCRFENSPSVLRYLRSTLSVFYCHESLRTYYEEPQMRPYVAGHSKMRNLMNRIDPLPTIYNKILMKNDYQNIRASDRVLVNSKFTGRIISSIYDLDPRVSYWGVDSDFFRPLQMDRGQYVLSVGSLTPLKGFDFLIRSLGKIPQSNRPNLRIICNFVNVKEEEFIQDLAAREHVSLQIQVGISDELLRRAYNEAYVTLYTPVEEPFGLVPIESMACGTPVVAVNEGGIPETVVHERAGLLVERDEQVFANAVQYMLHHPDIVEDYGRTGRKLAEENWSWEKAVERIEAEFRNVLIDPIQ